MVYAGAELRAFLARLTLVLPIDMGVFGLADVGRVYLSGETSGKWHASRGGGVWLAPLNRSATVYFAAATSEGNRAFYAGTGFAF